VHATQNSKINDTAVGWTCSLQNKPQHSFTYTTWLANSLQSGLEQHNLVGKQPAKWTGATQLGWQAACKVDWSDTTWLASSLQSGLERSRTSCGYHIGSKFLATHSGNRYVPHTAIV
jgi:hypothetical protein